MKNNTCEGLAQHLAQSNSGDIDTDFFFNHMASFEDTATTSFSAPFLIHTHSFTQKYTLHQGIHLEPFFLPFLYLSKAQ